MTQDEIIEALKQAGASPFYGCKTRNDGTDTCPCDDGTDTCTQLEFVGIKLPVENAAIITKFVEIILASQAQPTQPQTVKDALEQASRLTDELNPPERYTQVEREAYSLGIVHYWQAIRALIQNKKGK